MLMTKKYTLPPKCSVSTIVMRELTGEDELTASVWMEQNSQPAALETGAGLAAAEQKELIRLSLVEVDGLRVNVDGVPYRAMDGWSRRTMQAVRMCFQDLNGMTHDEAKKLVEGGQAVVGTALDRHDDSDHGGSSKSANA